MATTTTARSMKRSRNLPNWCVSAVQKKGKILVPSFAIGRTQQILYHLAHLVRDHGIPAFPIYIDSPLAIAANAVYMKHPELYDTEAARFIASGELEKYLGSVKVCQRRRRIQGG